MSSQKRLDAGPMSDKMKVEAWIHRSPGASSGQGSISSQQKSDAIPTNARVTVETEVTWGLFCAGLHVKPDQETILEGRHKGSHLINGRPRWPRQVQGRRKYRDDLHGLDNTIRDLQHVYPARQPGMCQAGKMSATECLGCCCLTCLHHAN